MYDRQVQEWFCRFYADEHGEVLCSDCQRQMECPRCKRGPCLLRSPGRFCRWFVSRRWCLDPKGHERFLDEGFQAWLEQTGAFDRYLSGQRGPLTRQEVRFALGSRGMDV